MASTSSRSILVFTANRAERGLLEPVIRAIEDHGLMVSLQDVSHLHTSFGDLFVSTAGRVIYNPPDLALVPCDRQEMVFVALALFYNNIPFAHLHAGDVGSGVHDEVCRWMISRMATLHFCNSPESAYNLLKSGEEPWRVHLVGSTAFDDINLDHSVLPQQDFDLLLVHPDTFSAENTKRDIEKALGLLDKYTVAVGPNEDKNYGMITEALLNYHYQNRAVPFEFHATLPRSQFLSLMKHCKRFITNSSSALYELPAFGIEKWVSIGLRNAKREPLKQIEPGASKKIAEILATIEINDRLLRKKFTVGS